MRLACGDLNLWRSLNQINLQIGSAMGAACVRGKAPGPAVPYAGPAVVYRRSAGRADAYSHESTQEDRERRVVAHYMRFSNGKIAEHLVAVPHNGRRAMLMPLSFSAPSPVRVSPVNFAGAAAAEHYAPAAALRRVFHASGLTLLRLHFVLNPAAWLRLRAEREAYALENPDGVKAGGGVVAYDGNMRTLLHGPRGGAQALMQILSQGLDPRLAAQGRYGRGVYLAEDARKADAYACVTTPQPKKKTHPHPVRYVIVCAAMLGRVGHLGGSTFPSLQREPHGFDSVSGTPDGVYREHVVYRAARVVPVAVAVYSSGRVLDRGGGLELALGPGSPTCQTTHMSPLWVGWSFPEDFVRLCRPLSAPPPLDDSSDLI
jgi:hypothetical protein